MSDGEEHLTETDGAGEPDESGELGRHHEILDPEVEDAIPLPTVGSLQAVHWVFFGISSFVVLMAILMRAPDQEHVYLPGMEDPVPGMCASRQLMNLECPGCGLTRSFISMGHGRIDRAWMFNPAGIIFFAFVAVQIPYRIVQVIWIGRTQRELWPGKFNWLLWLVMIAMLVQWLVRVPPTWF